MNFKSNLAKLAVIAAPFLGSAAANAAAIDVTGVVTEIAATAAPIGLIGSAVLLIVVAVKAFKWVRSAMS